MHVMAAILSTCSMLQINASIQRAAILIGDAAFGCHYPHRIEANLRYLFSIYKDVHEMLCRATATAL